MRFASEVSKMYTLENLVSPEFKEADYTDIDKIKDRIIFELVNYEMNEERLSDRPFIKIMDLYLVYHLFFF